MNIGAVRPHRDVTARTSPEGRGLCRSLNLRDWCADGVANAKLKLPILSPYFGLFVLSNFDQYGIHAFLELSARNVLIDLHSGVIDVVRGQEFTVEPYLVAVDAAQSQLDIARLIRIEFRISIRNRTHVLTDGFVEID